MNLRHVRVACAFVILSIAGIAHASHCAGYGQWAYSDGGLLVGQYNDPKWSACVGAASGRHETFESWVGAQYACQGNYPVPSGGTAYLRIYQCVKGTTTGYCTWADAPPGTPSGHQDNISALHSCGTCNAGFHWTGESACVLGAGDGCNFGAPECETCGNPIHGATGNKYQREVDYTGRGPFALAFVRSYNSFIGYSRANLGAGWRHNYDRVLKVRPYGAFGEPPYQWIVPDVKITATRADGKELTFTATVDAATGYALPDGTFLGAAPFVKERLEKVATGFRLYTTADEVEVYSVDGKLQSVSDRQGRTQRLEYDATGRLAAVTDAFGKRIALSYGAQGRLAQMTDPAGGAWRYGYDAAGRLVTVTGPDARVRTYVYENANIPHLLTGIVDENGDRFATWVYGSRGRAVISEHAGGADRVALSFFADGTTGELDALGRTRTMTFANVSGLLRLARSAIACPGCASIGETVTHDAAGNVQSRTDFNGNVTAYAHDARGLEQSRTEAAGSAVARTIATRWHATLRLPTQVDEPGRRTAYAYDEHGNRLSATVTDPATGEARTTTRTYDALGQVLTVDGPRTDVADVTTYAYYECTTGAQCGQVRSVTNAMGQVTEFTRYDDHGNPLEIVDPNGVTTTLAYDARQRLVAQAVAGATTAYAYDGVGQLVRVTLPGGARLDYTYDAAHRLTGVADALGNRIEYGLDAAGHRIREQAFDPAGALKRSQSQAFDALGRLQKVRNAAGEVVTEYAYDANGNRTGVVDYSAPDVGHATTHALDALHRTRQTTDAAGGVSQYDYDALDQLVAVTDPMGLTTSYTPNALGDVLRQASPDTGAATFTYDAAGNRKTQTDARGVTVAYSYDALNRLTLVDFPGDGQDVRYSYDSAAQPYGRGRLTGMVDASGATTLTYDARGNLVEERRAIAGRSYLTRYAYDDAGRVTGITYPSGRVISYARDAAGQVAGVLAGTDALAQGIGHLPFGPSSGHALGNGVLVTRAYDQDYRLTEYADGAAQHLRLYYDLRGNLDATEDLRDASRSQGFAYDVLSRLTSATGRYGAQGYTYDAVGGRLTGSGLTYAYATGSQRLASISDGTGFSYDAAGNVVAKGDLTLRYDAAGRLEQALRGGKRLGGYLYNAAGKRALKVAGEAGPDYLAMAEATSAAAQALRQDAQELRALADVRDAEAAELLDYASRLEQAASALEGEEDRALAEAADWLAQARPYLDKAATWQQRAAEDRLAAESAEGGHREALLRAAEREEEKAAEYLAKAQPYVDQQQQALARAAEFERQANALLAEAQVARDEARRLAGLAAAARAEAAQEIAQTEQLELQAAEYLRLAAEQEEHPPQFVTHFVYDRSGALLGEYREDGSAIREYAWLEAMPLALFSGGSTYFFHADHLGTPQKLTDADQRVVWDASYEPFGSVELLTAEVEQPLRFAGQYFDAETGLHQNWHRDYDPDLGRYLQSDPIGLKGGLNTYAYAAGKPTGNTDPSGLETCGSGFNEPFVPDNPFGFDFSPCCQSHDDCYDTCGNGKLRCDGEFLSCMRAACGSATSGFTHATCLQLARIYHSAVMKHGQTAYDNAQKKACNVAACKKKGEQT